MNRSKKGFTIVELVIVIAVIAILAAILIPTFSSLIRSSKLSADVQAVKTMNTALYADEKLHGKPDTVDKAMYVLSSAGYNSEDWKCLSTGYDVYWDKQKNQCVLYNSTTAEIEYPEGYATGDFTALGAGERFFTYNANVINAVNQDFSLNSGTNANKAPTEIKSGATEVAKKEALVADNSKISETAQNILASTGSTSIAGNTQLQSALNVDTTKDLNIKSTTIKSTEAGGAFASMDIVSVQNKKFDPVSGEELKSDEAVKGNLVVVSVNTSANATATEIQSAQQSAGTYIYQVFTQINTGKLDSSTSVVLAPGTVVDCSKQEWTPVEKWTGYFGSSDPDQPVIINGMSLTSASGYVKAYPLQGSGSQYYIMGFIGAVYGTSTIENITFRNVKIESPGKDQTIAAGRSNRNTIAMIGGIIPDPDDRTAAVDVTIRNIKVESSCSITGEASVGGIVGYIGAEQNYMSLHGKVLIEGCENYAMTQSLDSVYTSKGYSPVGGILGFTCRCDAIDAEITIKNCKFGGKVKGFGAVGGIVGNQQIGLINIDGCDVTGSEYIAAGLCTQAGANNGKDFTKFGTLVGAVNVKDITAYKDCIGLTGIKNSKDADVALVGNGTSVKNELFTFTN